MRSRWRRGIRFKLCCSYMAMVLVPAIMTGVLLYTQTIGNIRSQIDQELKLEITQQANDIRRKKAEMEEAAQNFSTLSEIVQYANGLYFDESELIIAYNQRVRAAFSWFDFTFSDSVRTNFFIGGELITEDTHFHASKAYVDEPWFQQASARVAESGLYWESAHVARSYQYAKGSGKRVFSCFVTSPLMLNVIMELEVGADELLEKKEGFACLDMQSLHEIVSGTRESIVIDAQTVQQAQTALTKAVIDGQKVLLRAVPLQTFDCILLHWTPLEMLTRETGASMQLFFGVLVIMGVLLFVMTWILSGSMSRRIMRITGAVESMYEGKYDINLPVDASDELGVLAGHMNEMASRLDNLLNKVLLAEMSAKDAELKALQSQINPHFIYNTLETFCMMAELGDNERLGEGIAEMGELMRYNLSGKRESTLHDEIRNVGFYFELQNLINNDRIALKVDYDPALEDMPMPKLLLQPMVENAILHGMEPRKTLHIFLKVERVQEGVIVRVCNDGKPIEPERLEHVNDMLSRTTVDPLETFDDCLALTNISRRLKLRYDARARVDVFSDESGTEVLIRIPYGGGKES